MKEYVQHKKNGLLFEHRNAKSLYKQMNFAIENHKEMEKFGNHGYLFSENGEVPNIETHCEKLIDVMNRMKKWRFS